MRLNKDRRNRTVLCLAIVAVLAITSMVYVMNDSDALTADEDLYVTKAPMDQYIDAWSNAVFEVNAVSTDGPIEYRWEYSAPSPISWGPVTLGVDPTREMLVVSPSDYVDKTTFRCIISNNSSTITLGPYTLNVNPEKHVHYVNTIEDLFKIGTEPGWDLNHTYIQTDDIDFTTPEAQIFLASATGADRGWQIRVTYTVTISGVLFDLEESADGVTWGALAPIYQSYFKFGDGPIATAGSPNLPRLDMGTVVADLGTTGISNTVSGYTGEPQMFMIWTSANTHQFAFSMEVSGGVGATGTKTSFHLGNFTPIIPIAQSGGDAFRYDGANHVIIGMEVATLGAAGMFVNASNAAHYTNIGLIGGSTTGVGYTGSIVGVIANASTLRNCYNTGTVTSVNSVAGGVAGNGSLTVTNCYNAGTVFGSNNAGGIIGQAGASTIRNCFNSGIVIGVANAGGIVGETTGLSGMSQTITDCYNIGTIRAHDNAGGIIGSMDGNMQALTIARCYNTGTVSAASPLIHDNSVASDRYNASADAGGIIGAVEKFSASGTTILQLTITESFNTGTIKSSFTTNVSVGGIAGAIGCSFNMKDCYNTGDLILENNTAGNPTDTVAIGGLLGTENSKAYVNSTLTISHRGPVIIDTSYNSGSLSNNLTSVPTALCAGPVVGETSSGGGPIDVSAEVFYLDTCMGSLLPTNSYGTLLTDSQLSDEATFAAANWNLVSMWALDGTINLGYPIFLEFLKDPMIITHPADAVRGVGDTATFTMSATMVNSYQWQVKVPSGSFVDIPGANSPSYTTGILDLTFDGNLYRCVVKGIYGTEDMTLEALLSVYPNVYKITPTVSKEGDSGRGTGGYVYKSGIVNVVGGGQETFTFTPRPNYTLVGIIITDLSTNQSVFTQASDLTNSSYTFMNVATDYVLEALFSEYYALTIDIVGDGEVTLEYTVSAGTVIETTDVMKVYYVPKGISVKLTGNGISPSGFSYWMGIPGFADAVLSNPSTFTMSAANTVTGYFGENLRVIVDGASGDEITVSIGNTALGIAEDSIDLVYPVPSGVTVSVSATPTARFSYWSSAEVSVASNSPATTFTMTSSAATLTGYFSGVSLTVSVDGTTGDAITVTVGGVLLGTATSVSAFTVPVPVGATVTISATPTARFSYWSSSETLGSYTASSTTLTMPSAAANATGHFGDDLVVTVDGITGDQITVTVGGLLMGTATSTSALTVSVPAGATVTISATPTARFSYWSSSETLGSYTTSTTTFTMPAAAADVTGHFSLTVIHFDKGPNATGTNPPDIIGQVGSNFTAPTVGDLQYPQHTFRGWRNGSVFFSPGATYEILQGYDGLTFTAVWVSDNQLRDIFLQYDKGPNAAGTNPPSVHGLEGTRFIAPEAGNLSYPEHTLIGWRNGNITLIPGNEYVLVRGYDMKVFEAVWEEIRYTVTVTVEGEGGIAYPPVVLVEAMGSVTIYIDPNDGYRISLVEDNGRAVVVSEGNNGIYTYTISGIRENHLVVVTFTEEDHNTQWWWIILLILLILFLIWLFFYLRRKFEVVITISDASVTVEGDEYARRLSKYTFTVTGTAFNAVRYRVGEGDPKIPLTGPNREYIIPRKDVRGTIYIEVF